MIWKRTLAVCIAIVALAASGAAWSQQKSAKAPAQSSGKSSAKQIERGLYLTTIMGCNDCHTPGTFYGSPDFSRTLSGSEVGWQGPWGVSYPRNLTPHPEAGLGKWTEKQIVDALRTGVRPDGSVLLPPMPWPMYATMPDEDAYAIAAYLKSIPANDHVVPKVVPPGQVATGSIIVIPPPPAWDAPRTAEAKPAEPGKN